MSNIKEHKLFGVDIPVKTKTCSFNGSPADDCSPYVNLYIRTTNQCQCKCKFCEFADGSSIPFDDSKFRKILEELNSSNISLGKINLTGGEPGFDLGVVDIILGLVRRYYPHIYITVNSNGYQLKRLLKFSSINCIALSRHHYNDVINKSIFNSDLVPSIKLLNELSEDDKLRISLRCNIIKGYIDSKDEALKYLDEMSKYGFIEYGFVSLMKVNKYCEDNFINYSELDLDNFPNSFMTCSTVKYNNLCTCKNYNHFTKDGNLVKFYSRIDNDPSDNTGNIVYDVNKLKIGFTGATII